MLSRSSSARFVCTSCTRQFERRLQQQIQQSQRRRWQSTSSTASTSSTSASPHDIYDIVCVGGGPAGLSLLTALRANPVTAGLRLALIEAQDLGRTRAYAPTPDQFANRCSSLTPSSARFLDKIGAWSYLHRERVQGYQEMQVWDGVTGARIAFDWPPGTTQAQSPDTGSTIAYMVENNNLTAGLLQRLDELGGVDVFDGSRVDSIGFGPEDQNGMDLSQWPAIQLSGQASAGKKLLARLLVGADGANSPVRSFADIEARGWDYERHGVVATMLLEEGAGSLSGDAYKTAYQRFLPTGPVALLPLPGRFATLVWSTTPERAALLKSLSPEDFVSMVNAAFRLRPVDLTYMHGLKEGGQRDEVAWRLQSESSSWTSEAEERIPATMVGVQPGSVASFPLKLRHADTYISERIALVGDAAHTVHPLAGQGLNQGQGDAESLARTIAYSVEHGQDLGVRTSLEAYPAERYAANHVLMGVCDKLHKIYAIESGPLVPLRSLGLRAVDAMRPLKNFIMSQAASSGKNAM